MQEAKVPHQAAAPLAAAEDFSSLLCSTSAAPDPEAPRAFFTYSRELDLADAG
jgi:hypothetical protein